MQKALQRGSRDGDSARGRSRWRRSLGRSPTRSLADHNPSRHGKCSGMQVKEVSRLTSPEVERLWLRNLIAERALDVAMSEYVLERNW